MGDAEWDIWAAAGTRFAASRQRSPESSGKRGSGKISYNLGWPRKEMQRSEQVLCKVPQCATDRARMLCQMSSSTGHEL